MINLNNTGITRYAVINANNSNLSPQSMPNPKQKNYFDNPRALTEQEKNDLNPNKNNNTLMYLGIGVGILALLLILK